DSRVQKQARSAAAAGFDVILLGLAKTGPGRSWPLGGAEARLVPFATPLARRRNEFRRNWLVAPFAYPKTNVAEHRRQWVRARESGIRQAVAAKPGGLQKQVLRGRLAAARLTGKWVGFRGWQSTFGRRVRRRLDRTPTDVVYTAFWRALYGD